MRHRVYGRHLGRNKDSRTTLFKGLVRSLFIFESIETTEAKAKSIKGLVDKLINQAKSPKTRLLVSQFIAEKQSSEKLIKDIAPRFKTRNSGYTSLVKTGRRVGDGAMLVRMSLMEGPVSKVISEKVVEKKEEKISKLKARTGQSVRKTK